jgi:hypothetical protein
MSATLYTSQISRHILDWGRSFLLDRIRANGAANGDMAVARDSHKHKLFSS